MSTESIQLEGTQEQVSELLRAVEVCKTVLFQLGGDNVQTDASIEKRLSRLSYWSELLQAKINQ